MNAFEFQHTDVVTHPALNGKWVVVSATPDESMRIRVYRDDVNVTAFVNPRDCVLRRRVGGAGMKYPDCGHEAVYQTLSGGKEGYCSNCDDTFDLPSELLETEEVYVGSPGSYGLAIVIGALALFILIVAVMT